MEVVLAERAAERCQSSPALLCSSGAGASAAKTGSSIVRSPRWGADGRRTTGRELSQAGCNGACAECRQSCSACGGKKRAGKAAGGRGVRSNGRGAKRVAVGRRQRPKGSTAAPAPHGSSEVVSTAVPVEPVATTSGGLGTKNVPVSHHALLSEFLDEYNRGRAETNSSDDTRNDEARIRRLSASRQESTAGEEQRGACFACGMESSAFPLEEKLENSA